MFIFLLGLISIAGAAANPLTARSVCANPPRGDDKIRKAFFEGHNKIRQELATGLMDDDGGALTGSTSLFMLAAYMLKNLYDYEFEIVCVSTSSKKLINAKFSTIVSVGDASYSSRTTANWKYRL
ncbi:hypothetical protein NECAME_02741 [Necator americanus]|uniref:SCP domain-containing protein n=1 Tax=Necator americanus TaxID=51031 RepID=W2TD02_NECAM|nr:hypothetical protein NECAME_02741 [Necator americanus]ETN78877.1 hypothetical protein NECAME_02741 [Necator americanus]